MILLQQFLLLGDRVSELIYLERPIACSGSRLWLVVPLKEVFIGFGCERLRGEGSEDGFDFVCMDVCHDITEFIWLLTVILQGAQRRKLWMDALVVRLE